MIPMLVRASPTKYARYVEPFAGSASLFFSLRPKNAVLGDLNHELIETYQAVRDSPSKVGRLARSFEDTEAAYYRIRDDVSPGKEVIFRAARFIYLNRHCFNGVYRTNKLGHFNVPRGTKTGSIQDERFFSDCAKLFASVKFIAGDFTKTLKHVRKGDFVYLDPPYSKEGRRPSGEYGYGSFEEKDLNRLNDELERIDRLGAVFLLSYSTELENLRSDWSTSYARVQRSVAGFAEKRTEVREILVSNRSLTCIADASEL
jgi:DNA adenine methylase